MEGGGEGGREEEGGEGGREGRREGGISLQKSSVTVSFKGSRERERKKEREREREREREQNNITEWMRKLNQLQTELFSKIMKIGRK